MRVMEEDDVRESNAVGDVAGMELVILREN